MAALKLEYRNVIALQTGVALETVPDVSSLVIWEHYQIEKDSYDDLSEKFKIKFLETFLKRTARSSPWSRKLCQTPLSRT